MANFDCLIKGGTILDGTGSPRVKADLGIEKQKITEIGDLTQSTGTKAIDAKGLFVTPGFIDCHSHSDFSILIHPTGDSKVMQGVTTELNGTCGYAGAPIDKDEWWRVPYIRMAVGWSMHYSAAAYNSEPLPYGKQVEVDWSTMKEYLDRLEKTKIGLNFATLVGHGQVRYYAMGMDARAPEEDEFDHMKSMVEQAMQEGAFGLSTGLSGSPGCWATTGEIIELCKIARKYNGVYMPHQRHSSFRSSIEESLEIAEKSGIRLCMSHTRLTPETRKLVEDARAKGMDVTFDMFAHSGSIGGNLVYLLPNFLSRRRDDGFKWIIKQLKDPKVRERFKKEYKKWKIRQVSVPGKPPHKPGPNEVLEPDFEKWRVQKVWTTENQKYIGKTFVEIAKERGVDPWTAWFDMEVEEGGYMRWSWAGGGIHEAALDERLKVPYVSIETDSLIQSPRGVLVTSADPRGYGTYPLFLEFIRKTNCISWEDMIVKMTLNPAKTMGIQKDRGLLKKGYWADVTIFNPETVAPGADYWKCLEMSQGINHNPYPIGFEYVIVNGEVVVEKAKLTGARPGHVLRNKAS